MRKLTHCLLILCCLLFVASELAAAKGYKNSEGLYRKSTAEVIAQLPAEYQAWLKEVELIITEDELKAFFEIGEDYQRDAFIKRFWRIRDRYPKTSRNEYYESWKRRVQEARGRFESLDTDRARVLLLNGFPDSLIQFRCSGIYPLEVWFYDTSDQARRRVFLIFYRVGGLSKYRLWRGRFDGLDELIDRISVSGGDLQGLRDIEQKCRDGEVLVAAIAFALNDPIGFEQLTRQVMVDSTGPSGEWIATFNTYSTELPADAEAIPVSLNFDYPGRRQSRTAVQTQLTVPREAAVQAELADYRSYNFVVTGEVLRDDELFDNFRYKFDFPEGQVPGESISMVLERFLRPGEYQMILKLEDVNGKKFFRTEQEISVPRIDKALPPPPPSDPETARLLAEANAAIAAGETTLKLVPPQGNLITGYVRFDTLATGEDFSSVHFSLDDKVVLQKRRPPFSVDLDLGELPRARTLAAIGYGPDGAELARDEILINANDNRFAVELVEPRKGKTYAQSLRAVAQIDTPEGSEPERVEFYLNETRLATLYQEPWELPVVLPSEAELAYVRAVAFLPDGNLTEDLVFVNAPEYLEEVDVQFVELYTTVVDRNDRPIEGLTKEQFRVSEDGVAQQIARFERVRNLPIHAAILLDISQSMEESLGDAQDAALGFFQQTLEPKDRAAFITFNDRPELRVKFTNEVDELAGGLAGLKAERGTALYDSVIFSLYYFNGIRGQRALIVLSDGKDEASRFSFEDTLEFARRAGVSLYTIALRDDAAHKKLSKIAEATGGRSFLIDSVAQLEGIYAGIEAELRSKYLIAYQSSNSSESDDFRSVRLDVDVPGAEAKTLKGYYP
ncbi:MAG: VWA domain-containing protein [Acidobacteriota bacterium]